MTQQEALHVLALSQLPASEDELLRICNELSQRAEENLVVPLNGAAATAIMDELNQIRQAKLALVPYMRGPTPQNSAQQPRHPISSTGGIAGTSSTSCSPSQATPAPRGRSQVSRVSAPGSTPPTPPSPSPTRRPIWPRIRSGFATVSWAVWRKLVWPLATPRRTFRWVHTRLRSWRASRQAGPSAGAQWKRRIVVAAVLAVVCAVAAFCYLPGGASVIFVTFPASDVFLDEAYITTAPSPEHFKVNWGWRKVTCVTPEGLAHRFHVFLLPGQTYRVKVNLQDDTHAVTRQSSSVATTQDAETE